MPRRTPKGPAELTERGSRVRLPAHRVSKYRHGQIESGEAQLPYLGGLQHAEPAASPAQGSWSINHPREAWPVRPPTPSSSVADLPRESGRFHLHGPRRLPCHRWSLAIPSHPEGGPSPPPCPGPFAGRLPPGRHTIRLWGPVTGAGPCRRGVRSWPFFVEPDPTVPQAGRAPARHRRRWRGKRLVHGAHPEGVRVGPPAPFDHT